MTYYFKTIIFSLVEKLETISLSKKINLNPKNLEEDYNQSNDLTDINQKNQKLDKNIYRKNTLFQEEI